MAKVTLSDVVNLQNESTAVSTINNNSDAIATAFENTLSRDGTSPNTMGADLDMNSNRILNLPGPISDQEPVRLGDLSSLSPGTVSVSSYGQTLIAASTAAAARTVLALAAIASSGSASDLTAGTVPAARMPAHTGDVTSSAGSVALTIPNDTVTYAKMQNVSAENKILGRITSGAGDVEELTRDNVRTVLGLATTSTAGRLPRYSDTTGSTAATTGIYEDGSGNVGIGNTGPGAKLDVTGAIRSSSSITSTSATGGIGYATGAGGTVTQLTSKGTGVTLNTMSGTITTHNANLGANSAQGFIFTNSNIAVGNTIIFSQGSGGTANSYAFRATITTNGQATVSIHNWTGGALAEAVEINFTIIKSAKS